MLKIYIENYKDTKNIKTLYHTVFDKDTYDFVQGNGIVADDNNYVYLSKYPYKSESAYATFKVNIPDSNKLFDWREFWYDENGNEFDYDHEWDPDNPYFIYVGNIPKSYITVI